jgi:hypothetical protein
MVMADASLTNQGEKTKKPHSLGPLQDKPFSPASGGICDIKWRGGHEGERLLVD